MSVPEIPCKNSSYKRKLAAEIAKLWYVTLGKYGTNKLDVTACSNWHYEYNKNQSNDQMKQWKNVTKEGDCSSHEQIMAYHLQLLHHTLYNIMI